LLIKENLTGGNDNFKQIDDEEVLQLFKKELKTSHYLIDDTFITNIHDEKWRDIHMKTKSWLEEIGGMIRTMKKAKRTV